MPPATPTSSPTPLSAAELETLTTHTLAAKKAAYCPYSHFPVGACLLTASGTYLTGANVENASYPVGLCAERNVLARAVTDGFRDFRALGVAAECVPAAAPCGMCRQFIREFCPPDFPIYMHDGNGKVTVKTLEELLPMSFGPEQLQNGRGKEGGSMGEGR